MKVSNRTAALVFVAGGLMLASGALAQRASDATKDKAQAEIAHLGYSRKSIAFGTVKAATTRSFEIKNTGTSPANVTVGAATAPFTVTADGGSFSLAPGAVAAVSVEFAPVTAGKALGTMTVQCSNCNTAAEQNVTISLSGKAKAPVATPTSTASTGATPTATPTASAGGNTLPISVTAGPYDYIDGPFVSLTICATGTTDCTTVNDILLDTGSFGLRIFGSQLSGLGITPNTNDGSEIGQCAFFGSGSTWGSVSTVDVTMGSESKITIPIQVIDDIGAFASEPRDCTEGTQAISSPDEAGFNGLLGVGQYSNDLIFTDYFDCAGNSCTLLNSPPNSDVVVNPASSLPVDNNGVVVSLPAISADGESTTDGTLYFGIGTQANNQPSGVKTYRENSNVNSPDYLEIDTVFKGTTAGAFFDTGSNGLFFNDSSIAECSDGSGFYCPASTLSESATNESVGSSVSGVVDFQISNADDLFNSNDAAFDDIGGTFDGGNSYDGFDWGLPFFFGRTVYMGIQGASSSLGNGPYVAY